MGKVRQIVAALLLLAPSIAAACPACVGQSRNTSVLKLLGAFMLVPFGIFFFVQRAVRRELRGK